jgi:hypothetical protein
VGNSCAAPSATPQASIGTYTVAEGKVDIWG